MGSLVKDHDPVQKVTLIPRGQAQGLTWFSPDEEQMLVSRAQLKARTMGALGGRAAEDVVFGRAEVTTGAGGDIQQVASIARQMVTRFGMSNLGTNVTRGWWPGSFPGSRFDEPQRSVGVHLQANR